MTPDEKREHVRQLLSTIGISALALTALGAAYLFMHRSFYLGESGPPFEPIAGVVLALFLISIGGIWLEHDKTRLFGGAINHSSTLQRNGLFVIALTLVITLGVMCFLSGGVRMSPFSHFLIGVTSLSIVLATEWPTRLLMAVVALTVYFVVSRWEPITPPQHEWEVYFDWLCLLAIISSAFLHKAIEDPPENLLGGVGPFLRDLPSRLFWRGTSTRHDDPNDVPTASGSASRD